MELLRRDDLFRQSGDARECVANETQMPSVNLSEYSCHETNGKHDVPAKVVPPDFISEDTFKQSEQEEERNECRLTRFKQTMQRVKDGLHKFSEYVQYEVKLLIIRNMPYQLKKK